MLGHHRHASETPFQWRSLAGRWWPAYSGVWILPPVYNTRACILLNITYSWHRTIKTVKPLYNGHPKLNKTKILMTTASLMKVESIAECFGAYFQSILQYFCPVLSDYLSWKPLFGLFESGRFTHFYCSKPCVKRPLQNRKNKYRNNNW